MSKIISKDEKCSKSFLYQIDSLSLIKLLITDFFQIPICPILFEKDNKSRIDFQIE